MAKETRTTAGEAWGETVTSYTSTVAKASAIAAHHLVGMVQQLHDIDKTSSILDLGSGTGVLALDVARNFPSTQVLATDISAGMVESVANLNVPNVSTKVLDALEVNTFGKGAFSHIFSTFALQFVLEPDLVLSRAYDTLNQGGVIGLGLWYKNLHPFEIWQKACRTIDPTYQIENEFIDPNAWVKPEQVEHHLRLANFSDVQIIDKWIDCAYASAEAYMDFWDSGKNPSALYVIQQWKGDRQQAMDAVRKVVREQYGDGQDIKLHVILAVGEKA